MKKTVLSSFMILILGIITSYAQYFVDGSNYFKLQYNNVATSPSCVTNFTTHGGAAFSGGNVATAGYSDIGSNDAIKFTADASFIDECADIYMYDVFYTNDDEVPEQCRPMSYAGYNKGIDMSTYKTIRITAKADVAGTVIQFGIASGTDGGWPNVLYGPLACLGGGVPIGANFEITLSTTYETYTLDYNITEFNAWGGKTDVNIWGIKFKNTGDVAYIQTIEFGNLAAGTTSAALTKNFSVYPNPSAGNVTVNTKNNNGTLVVTDMLGAVVETITTSSAQDVYQLSIANKGMYLLNFKTEAGNSTEKIIIE